MLAWSIVWRLVRYKWLRWVLSITGGGLLVGYDRLLLAKEGWLWSRNELVLNYEWILNIFLYCLPCLSVLGLILHGLILRIRNHCLLHILCILVYVLIYLQCLLEVRIIWCIWLQLWLLILNNFLFIYPCLCSSFYYSN